jgi:spore germination protein YaaH
MSFYSWKERVNALFRRICWKRTAAAAVLLFVIVSSNLAYQPWTAAASSLPFRDIDGSYAKEAISRLYQLNLIDGTGNGKFEPYRVVTRAEFTTMIARLFRLEPVDGAIPVFSDVPRSSWAYGWVEAAAQLGLVSGLSANHFGPGRAVSRQDAAVMIARAAKLSGSPVAGVSPVYLDQGHIAGYALESVLRLRQLGLMSGYGSVFRPADPITRQEAAVLLDNIVRLSGWMPQIQAPSKPNIRLAWQYGLTTAQFEQQVQLANVNTLSPRWYFLEPSGIERTTNYDAELTKWAHRNGYSVWAMVGNHFDRDATHDHLSDAKLRAAAVSALTNEVQQNGLDGLNIDFENVAPADRSAFTSFVAELADALHPLNATLSVNLSPDFGTDWTAAYDYDALGQSADYIVMMGYDEHWGNDPQPGSVASLPWLKKGLGTLLQHVPANQVILAMPLYTRDWTVSGGRTVASEEWSLTAQNDFVANHALPAVWDAELGQYTTSYRIQGKDHALWLEDGRSLSEKMKLGETMSIAGYAYWSLGGESPDVWASLRNAYRYASYRFN